MLWLSDDQDGMQYVSKLYSLEALINRLASIRACRLFINMCSTPAMELLELHPEHQHLVINIIPRLIRVLEPTEVHISCDRKFD